MSLPPHGDDPRDPTVRPAAVPPGDPVQPPGTLPTSEPAEAWDAPATRGRLGLDLRRYWVGAVATVVVCALVGLAASVIFDQAFDVGLLGPSATRPRAGRSPGPCSPCSRPRCCSCSSWSRRNPGCSSAGSSAS